MKTIQLATLAGVCSFMFSCSEPNEPAAESSPESERLIVTRVYKVSFLPLSESDGNDPFQRTEGEGNSNLVNHSIIDVEALLESQGITFPEGASASNSGLPIPGIMMRNTVKNHKKLQSFIKEAGGSWEIVDPNETGANSKDSR